MLSNSELFLDALPPLPEKMQKLKLSPQASSAMSRHHPWVFRKGIIAMPEDIKAGDLCGLYNSTDKFLGLGYYDPDELIRVRVMQFAKNINIDQAFFDRIFAVATKKRERFLQRDTNGFRIINGESDGVPGVILDRYDKTLVMKIYSIGLMPYLKAIINSVLSVCNPDNFILRPGSLFIKNNEADKNLFSKCMVLKGSGDTVLFRENGIIFEADPVNGQKTGFFLDQRDNRSRVESLAEGKRVLNMFSYTGGFSIYAARGGAVEVASVDGSAPAMEAARKNFEHNSSNARINAARKEYIVGDAFEVFENLKKDGRQFDMVIIDPPSFAKKNADLRNATGAYFKLARMGIDVLAKDGILVAASCSSRVTPDLFFSTIISAAKASGRNLKIIEKTGHAADHPITFPEATYLKCLFARAQ